MNCRLLACSASALVALTVASAAAAEITVLNWQR